MTPAIDLRAVCKQFPGFQLGPINLSVATGRAMALIGPNGAGNTTLMNLLAGASRPGAGKVKVLGRQQGRDNAGQNTDIGYASDGQPFFENWTGRRNLAFLAGFYPNWSPDLQTHLVSRLEVQLDKKVSTLSRGNRVKLALVSALARRPQLLLLDEPTAGLDPLVRSEVLDVLFEYLGDDGPTLVYSTHILSDVSRLADELTFIRNGKLILQTTRDDLEESWRRLTFRYGGATLPPATAQLLTEHKVQGSMHRALTSDFGRVEDQLRALGAGQVDATRMSLEEISVQVLKAAAMTTDRVVGNHGGTHA